MPSLASAEAERDARLSEALGPEVVAHLARLEAAWAQPSSRVQAQLQGGPGPGSLCEVDAFLAGGGLSLIYATWLAQQGWKVAVADAGRIGHSHREWNVSQAEMKPLVASGLLSEEEAQALVVHRYRHGVVRWHGGQSHAVRGVLDCVVDAEALLGLLRAKALAAGAQLLDGHRLTSYRLGPGGVALRLESAQGPTELSARLLLDGLGASSPHAHWDLACPTVGGVLGGLVEGEAVDEVDYGVGEILASTEGIEAGRQHIWEGFPGPNKAYTTYLFHYAEPKRLGPQPLRELYARFFATRPRYKKGEAQLRKPTYGIIPAHTRLRPMPVAPHDRVVLVGDAAGRHSPLTFCGFGSMIRSFWPVGQGLSAALKADRLDAQSLAAAWSEPPCLGVMGALALMMDAGRQAPWERDPAAINALLEVAFASLAEAGEPVFAAFVRDELPYPEFQAFMLRVAKARPGVWLEAFGRLGPRELASWLGQLWAYRRQGQRGL